jgi:hypothetical protein
LPEARQSFFRLRQKQTRHQKQYKNEFLIKFINNSNLLKQIAMSKSIDFVKSEDPKFSLQLNTFADGLGSATPPNGGTVGFTPGEISEAQKDADYVKYVIEQQDKAKAFSQSYTKYKNDLRMGSATPITEPVMDVPAVVPPAVAAGVEARFRQKAAKAKNSGNYTQAIGEAWDIVAPVSSGTLGVPTFEIHLAAGHPILDWIKDISDGVDIWKDDGSGTGFIYIGRDNKSPFPDKSDLPAAGQSKIWKYKLIYVVNDEPVGDYSAVLEVTVKGV